MIRVRLRYITPTGTHYTPWHTDFDLLQAYVNYLQQNFHFPHYIEEE